jgi:hypothetical protein
MTDTTQMNAYGQIPIGIKNGEALGLTQWYPVKTSWSGHVVMVDAKSYEEAIDIHMRSRKEGKP